MVLFRRLVFAIFGLLSYCKDNNDERCELIQTTMDKILSNNAKRQLSSDQHLSTRIERRAFDKTPKGVWEYLNEYRSNPSLWANFQQNPRESLTVIRMMIDSFKEYFNDPIVDPMLVRKMILERRLNPNLLHDSPVNELMDRLGRKRLFNRLFFDAPDLLAYVASAVSLKLPDEQIDIVNSSISCEKDAAGERRLLRGRGTLPWNLQLKDMLIDIFPDDLASSSRIYDRTNQFIIECAQNPNDYERLNVDSPGSGQSSVDQTFSYKTVSDQQISFLNTALDHPVILRILLSDEQFIHTVLEQALLTEMIDSIDAKKRERTHQEIINELIRHPVVAKAVTHDPGSFLDAVNRIVSSRGI